MAVNGKVIPRELKPDANAQRAQPRRQRMPSKRDAANAKGKSAPGDAAVPVIATALDTPPPPSDPSDAHLDFFANLDIWWRQWSSSRKGGGVGDGDGDGDATGATS